MTQSKEQKTVKEAQNIVNYRFNIISRLHKFTPQYKSDFFTGIVKKSGFSIAEVKRLVYRKHTETKSINYIILKAIAEHFMVNVEALENFATN